MNKIFHILRYEIYSLISRKSFWFGALGVPTIAFLIYAGIAWINRTQAESVESPTSEIQDLFNKPEDNRPRGYVDQSGLIRVYPDGLDVGELIGYTNVLDAKNDLETGKISAYFVIPSDYLATGKIKVYTQEYDLLSAQEQVTALQNLIDYNLLNGQEQIFFAINDPLANLREESIAITPAPARDRDNQMTFFLPYAVMMLFYISIMGSSGLLLNSVTKEKENRVLEILMVSTDPYHLLLGKMAGLGLVGLFQVFVWAVSSYALLRLSGQTYQLPVEFQLDPSIIGWGLVFFILGYLVYAALMAGVGALVPNLREGSQATTIIVVPMMIPLFLISALIDRPNSLLTTVLSIFPLTAPTTMMLRLAATPLVPLWQILLSIALLVITDYFTIRAVAGFFRAQTMLSGQPFKLKKFFTILAGRK